MGILKRYILPVLALVFLSIVLSFRLFQSFNFHPDFARDAYDILTIIQGKMTLIGPKLSFGGIYSGPYYYYLLAPIFFLTSGNLDSLLAFNLFLFILGTAFFYYLLSRKYGHTMSIFGGLVLGLLPVYVVGARGPWNASTYLPFLLLYLSLIFFVNHENRRLLLALTGFLGGMVASIHLVTLPVLAIGMIYLFAVLKRKTDFIFFLCGFSLAFAPLLLFEAKHGFVMTKNTFLVGSYKSFMDNANIPNAESGKANPFQNLLFLGDKIKEQLALSPFVYLAVMAWFFGKSKFRERYLSIASFAIMVFFAVVLRYQFGNHYLFPVSLFVVFSLVSVLLSLKHQWILGLVIFVELLGFPFNSYKPATRLASTYEKRVDFAVEKGLVREGESFNIIQVSKDYLGYIPIGHEYRFFLRKKQLIPRNEFEYSQSDKLLIFSEVQKFDLSTLDSWEMREFGKENIENAKAYRLEWATLYVLDKNK